MSSSSLAEGGDRGLMQRCYDFHRDRRGVIAECYRRSDQVRQMVVQETRTGQPMLFLGIRGAMRGSSGGSTVGSKQS